MTYDAMENTVNITTLPTHFTKTVPITHDTFYKQVSRKHMVTHFRTFL